MSLKQDLEVVGSFPREGSDLPRRSIRDGEEARSLKVKLVNDIGRAESIRDFGGLYLVHGRFLLEPAVALGSRYAHMIDITPKEVFQTEIDQAIEKNPNLRVDYTCADFRYPDLYRDLPNVEVSLLYEVLLHQDNYVEVIRNVTGHTDRYVCVAQPCLRESWFGAPAGAVCLQFYDQAVKEVLRRNSFWPEEPPIRTFETRYWMWGHSISHLIAVFGGFGWELDFGEVLDNFRGDHWDYPLLRFRRAQ